MRPIEGTTGARGRKFFCRVAINDLSVWRGLDRRVPVSSLRTRFSCSWKIKRVGLVLRPCFSSNESSSIRSNKKVTGVRTFYVHPYSNERATTLFNIQNFETKFLQLIRYERRELESSSPPTSFLPLGFLRNST